MDGHKNWLGQGDVALHRRTMEDTPSDRQESQNARKSFFFFFLTFSFCFLDCVINFSAKFMTQIDKQPEMLLSNPDSASSSLP